MFTFRKECILKYDEEVYDLCMEVFDTLPICSFVGRDYLCSHAGFGPGFTSIKDLNNIDRFGDIPAEGVICDILWADPCEDEGAEDIEF
jgi:serine/threonine-protein phosphatase 2B catalytic subunit